MQNPFHLSPYEKSFFRTLSFLSAGIIIVALAVWGLLANSQWSWVSDTFAFLIGLVIVSFEFLRGHAGVLFACAFGAALAFALASLFGTLHEIRDLLAEVRDELRDSKRTDSEDED